MRFLLLAAALLFTSPVYAGEKPFLTSKELNLAPMLPAPVANGSEADLAQQAQVIAAQKAASPERITLAAADADESVFDMFTRTLGPAFKRENMAVAAKFFDRIGETEDEVVDPIKKVFGRTRPWIANKDIVAHAKKTSSGAYPSGHTTRVTMTAAVLAAMVPEKKDIIWARAREYAESRVIGGMHYPADLEAGFRAGSAIAGYMWAMPEFRAEYEPARIEVRKVLGLQ